MSTRSYIARRMESGYEGVYCHWDGYPEHNGAILQKYYLDPHKVRRLLSYGDISVLGPDIGDKHDFDDRSQGIVTTFYGRDRGEFGEHTHPTALASLHNVLEQAASMGCEFVYVFEDEHWTYSERGPQFFGTDDGSEFAGFKTLDETVQ